MAGTSPAITSRQATRDSPDIRRVNPPLTHHQRPTGAAIALDQKLVERTEVSLRGRDQRIRIGALRGDGASVLGKPHRNLRLRVGAFGHGVHLIELDRKSTRLNSSHLVISYAVFCL